MNGKSIESIVKKYLGIPYRHAGRDLTGLDCLGLAWMFYKDCGINLPDGDGREYTPDWVYEDPERYLRGILKLGKAVSLNKLQPLDFVYFRIGKYISHGGVMIDSRQFIHILQNSSVHLSSLYPVWRKRLVGARRLTDDR